MQNFRLLLLILVSLTLAALGFACNGRAVTNAKQAQLAGEVEPAAGFVPNSVFRDHSDAVYEKDAAGLPVYRTAAELIERGAIRPHTAAENPYAGQYETVDDWILDNCKLLSDTDTAAVWGDKRVDGTTLYAYVDREGFVLPLEATLLHKHGASMAGGDITQFRILHAKGPLAADMAQRCSRLRAKAMGSYLPPVPDWLAANPPAGGAVLLPNGNVVTYGPLPAHPWEAPAAPAAEAGKSRPIPHLYSNSGELLYSGDQWQLYYRPDALDILNEREVDMEIHPGYLLFFERGTREFVQGFDYDGTELTAMPAQLTRFTLPLLWPELLQEIHLMQSA